jgi:hypothetical protein
VLGDGSLGGDAEVARDLRVGWLVPMTRDEARDVIQNLFLSLRAWQHDTSPAQNELEVGLLEADRVDR